MAITPVSTPSSDINPVYEPIIFEFTSNASGIFQLRADLYINTFYQITLDAPVELGTANEFKFDLAEMLQNHVEYAHITGATGHLLSAAVAAEEIFSLKVYEVTNVGGVISTNWQEDHLGTPEYSSGNFTAHLHAINPFETVSSYLMQEGSPKPFMTLRPLLSQLLDGEFIQLDFMTDVASVDMKIEEYDVTGTLTGTTTLSAYNVVRSRAIAIINTPSLTAGTKKIIVWLENNATSNIISTKMTLSLFTDCGTPIILHWGNYLGGMEQYYFTKKQAETARFSHVSVRKGDTGNIEDATGNRSVFYDGFTDIASDQVYQFLNEIPSNSKETHWRKNGTFYPVAIATQRCTRKYRDTEDLINTYKVSFELSKKTPVIRG